jgi:ABC-type phosphate/phosphonate transport system substrate-binding protein
MYSLPEVAGATRAWWSGLAHHFARAGIGGVPAALTHPKNVYGHWTEPNLLFSQTCGFPLTHDLAGKVRYVATPRYEAPGCSGAYYCSFIVVGEDSPAVDLADLKGGVCAVNGTDSQSGYNVLRAMAAPLAQGRPFFSRTVVSGGHRASIVLVRHGTADVAAIDCVTHALLSSHAPDVLRGTRVLCRSLPAPGLPYVTAGSAPADLLERLRDGLFAALADPNLVGTRAALLLAGAEVLADDAYDVIPEMERAGVSLSP